MNILHVHNHYRTPGGENRVFDATIELLTRKGHRIPTFERKSADIRGISGRVQAFVNGIYSLETKREFSRLLKTNEIDIVHIHNVYPLISPSILPVCKENSIPVVMRCPNYRLICPTALMLRNDVQCEKCLGGKEHWCFLTNCCGNLIESLGFTLRSYMARKLNLFTENVDFFLPPSEFVKRKLVDAGFARSKIKVLPNIVHSIDKKKADGNGKYVAFVGSLHKHKGIEVFMRSAKSLPDVSFKVAGMGPESHRLKTMAHANVHAVGHLTNNELETFFRQAAIVIVPSLAHETFGLAAAEAMGFGLPVIASNVGGLPEVVQDNHTGLLFEPGNVAELSTKIRQLMGDPKLRKQMGENGRAHCMNKFSSEHHYSKLLNIYSSLLSKSNRSEHAYIDA